MLLITGATGTNGRAVLDLLAQRGVRARAMVRDLHKAEHLRSPLVDLVEGDFDKPGSLRAALHGVNKAFLLTNSTERAEAQQLAFVEAARQAGVSHLVKLSQLHANSDSPVRFLRYHAVVEGAIRDAGMAYTFLRPNLFMQGLVMFRATISEQNAIYAPAKDARISLVDVRDIAAAAVAALTEQGHTNKIYDLTGPQALSHGEVAAILSEALGRTISYVDVPPEAMQEAMVSMHMPAWQVAGVLEDYAHYRRGEAQDIASGVRDATGNEPRSLAAFAHEHRSLFA